VTKTQDQNCIDLMDTSTIFRIIRDNFTHYSDREYNDVFRGFIGRCSRYYHNEVNFKIIVFDKDNSVYQLDNDGEIFGVELKTFADFKKRFESITGEKYIIDYRLNQK
jgi:hypothetical protein